MIDADDTRATVGSLTVAEAMRRITDNQMTMMCLAANQQLGTEAANRLLDLFGAARREVRIADAARRDAAAEGIGGMAVEPGE